MRHLRIAAEADLPPIGEFAVPVAREQRVVPARQMSSPVVSTTNNMNTTKHKADRRAVPAIALGVLMLVGASVILGASSLAALNGRRTDPYADLDKGSPFAPGTINAVVYQRTPQAWQPSDLTELGAAATQAEGRAARDAVVASAVASLRRAKRAHRQRSEALERESVAGRELGDDTVSDDELDGAADGAATPTGAEPVQGAGGAASRGLLQTRAPSTPEPPVVDNGTRISGDERLAAFLSQSPPPRAQLDVLTRMRSVCSIVVVVPAPKLPAYGAERMPDASPHNPAYSYAVRGAFKRPRHAAGAAGGNENASGAPTSVEEANRAARDDIGSRWLVSQAHFASLGSKYAGPLLQRDDAAGGRPSSSAKSAEAKALQAKESARKKLVRGATEKEHELEIDDAGDEHHGHGALYGSVDLEVVASRGSTVQRARLFDALRVQEYEEYLNYVLYPTFSGSADDTRAPTANATALGRSGEKEPTEEEEDQSSVPSWCPRRRIYVVTTNRTAGVSTLARFLNFGGLIDAHVAVERHAAAKAQKAAADASLSDDGHHRQPEEPDRHQSQHRYHRRQHVHPSLLFLDAAVNIVKPVLPFLEALHAGLTQPIREPPENRVPGTTEYLAGDMWTGAPSSSLTAPPTPDRLVGCTVTHRNTVLSYGVEPVVNAHGELAMMHRLSGYSLSDERVATNAATRVVAMSPHCFAAASRTWRRLGGLRSAPAASRVVEDFLLAGSRYRTASYHGELALIVMDPLMRALPFTRPQAQLFDTLRSFLVRALDDTVTWEGFAVDAGMDRVAACPAVVRQSLHGRLFAVLPLFSADRTRRVLDEIRVAAEKHQDVNVSGRLSSDLAAIDDDAPNDFGPRGSERDLWQSTIDVLATTYGAAAVVEYNYDVRADKSTAIAMVREFARIQAAQKRTAAAVQKRQEAEKAMYDALRRESAKISGGGGRRSLQQVAAGDSSGRAAAAKALRDSNARHANEAAFDKMNAAAIGELRSHKHGDVDGMQHQTDEADQASHVAEAFASERAEHRFAAAVLARRERELLRRILLVVRRNARAIAHRRARARRAFARLQALCMSGDDPFWELSLASSRHVLATKKKKGNASGSVAGETGGGVDVANPLQLSVATVVSGAQVQPVDVPAFLANYSVATPIAGSAVLAPYSTMLKRLAYRPLPPATSADDDVQGPGLPAARKIAAPPDEIGGVRVTWAGPCCGCCGFSSEIALILVPLATYVPTRSTMPPYCHCSGMPGTTADALRRIWVTRDDGSLHRVGDELLGWTEPPSPAGGEESSSSTSTADKRISQAEGDRAAAERLRRRIVAGAKSQPVGAGQKKLKDGTNAAAPPSTAPVSMVTSTGGRGAGGKAGDEAVKQNQQLAAELLWGERLDTPSDPVVGNPWLKVSYGDTAAPADHLPVPTASAVEGGSGNASSVSVSTPQRHVLPAVLNDLRVAGAQGHFDVAESFAGDPESPMIGVAPTPPPGTLDVLRELDADIDVTLSSATPPSGDGAESQPTASRSQARAAAAQLSPPVEVWVYHVDPVQARQLHWPEATVDYKVSRSMFEFSRIAPDWAATLADDAEYDEVWVPCDFVRDAFIASGVPARKVVVVPEPVDVSYYSPAAARKIDLPPALGRPQWRAYGSHTADIKQYGRDAVAVPLRQNFKFLSIFKWEPRKGWDALFRAYFGAFTRDDPVSLYVLTYHWWPAPPEGADPRDPKEIYNEVISLCKRELKGDCDPATLPHFEIITQDVSDRDILSLYASADAFVLPTRGEGWGLPVIQAMSMALPTLVTRYSGPLQFTTNDTALYIEVESIERVVESTMVYGRLPDMTWANPDARQLALLMKQVAFEWTPQQRSALGKRARSYIRRRFDSGVVASAIARRLKEIEVLVRRKVARGLGWRGNTTGKARDDSTVELVNSLP